MAKRKKVVWEPTISESTRVREADEKILKTGKVELEEIIRRAFDFFWEQANPENGQVKDRNVVGGFASISALGFGIPVLCIGIERGWVQKDEVYDRIIRVLKFMRDKAKNVNGFYYHFLDLETGVRVSKGCELSSIDTSLFVGGALFAGQYFKGTEIEDLADQFEKAVNWKWMMNRGRTLSMGWFPERGFISHRWKEFSEHLMMYLMAIGTDSYPIKPTAWDWIHRPEKTAYGNDYVYCYTESLFVYLLSQAWVDFRGRKDSYMNYWENSKKAAFASRQFVAERADKHKGYEQDVWGLSECDGPTGYRHFGAMRWRQNGTLSPYSMVTSYPLLPDLVEKGIQTMIQRYGSRIWGRYGFVSGFNAEKNWFSREFIGIHLGLTAFMLENHLSGFIWKYFNNVDCIKKGMERVGLKPE